jgi:transposase
VPCPSYCNSAPAGEKLRYYYSNVERGLTLRRYWTMACQGCPIKSHCTTGPQRRTTRWEHEDVLEAVQRRLDLNRLRRKSEAGMRK